MTKALAILNSMRELELKNELSTSGTDAAIVELEEAMKPKTCDGCRYGAFGVNGLGFEVECRIGYNCSRGREDRYEPKDNAWQKILSFLVS